MALIWSLETTARSMTPTLTIGFWKLRDEGLHDLRGGGYILVADDDGRLALEFSQLGEPRVLGGAAQEGVFDDVAAGAGAPRAGCAAR